MKEPEIYKSFDFNIDDNQDGIKFNLLLFNQGKYDKEQLRTIVRNTGVKLEIVNEQSKDVEIRNIFFGIFKNNIIVKRFSSSKIAKTLPSILVPGESITFYFYGSEIKDKLDDFNDETAMFYFSSDQNDNYIYSSIFNGDSVENLLTDLEDGEIANWGGIVFNHLDNEVSY